MASQLTAAIGTAVVGIDFAAQPKKTWAAFGEVVPSGGLRITAIRHPVSDDAIIEMVHDGPAVVAIDVPFGWPDEFVSFVSQHNRREVPPDVDSAHFQFRMTDRFVRQKISKRPLSVSTNLIGITAHRMAALMKRLPPCDLPPLKILGSDTQVIEVYPSATLIALGVPGEGYKNASAEASELRAKIVDQLADDIEFSGVISEMCRDSDDALDACVCALTACLYLQGRTWSPSDDPLVGREGWIFFPKQKMLRS